MTQDVMQHGAQATELESITVYIADLAVQHGVPAPYNRAILKLGREKFRPGFTPMTCEEVMAAVEAQIRSPD
jgi:Ketopantoate reductase PanE/ApbA C terminal